MSDSQSTPTVEAAAIAAILADWFAASARPLPWREAYAPYHVWLSEIMLQQTQMERGVVYFQRFVERFPDVASLAAAAEDEVLKLWEGLGYYSRARNLLKAAQVIQAEHDGIFPESATAIQSLPGIGPYTTGAIRSIAFDAVEPAVDANVERVLARLLDHDEPVKTPASRRFFETATRQILACGSPRVLTQALMEFGALVCSKKPQCADCVLAAHCQARALGIVAERPIPGKRPAIAHLNVATGVLLHGSRVFVQKRLPEGAWAGLWEFPGGRVEEGETPEAAVVREFKEETEFDVRVVRKLDLVRHGYTRYRVSLHCFELELVHERREPVLTAAESFLWLGFSELAGYAFPAGHRKLIASLAGGDVQLSLPFVK